MSISSKQWLHSSDPLTSTLKWVLNRHFLEHHFSLNLAFHHFNHSHPFSWFHPFQASPSISHKCPQDNSISSSCVKYPCEIININRFPRSKVFRAPLSYQNWVIILQTYFQNMFDNMSGFWRMQCADEDFEITPKNYSLYLDPHQRDKEIKITWVYALQIILWKHNLYFSEHICLSKGEMFKMALWL